MNFDDVKILLDAGFTADEIRGMMTPGAEPAADPEPKADPEPAPAADPQPSEEPKADETARLLEKLAQSISTLQQTITANAARTTETKGPATPESAEEILAKIINPSFKKGE